MAAQPQPIAQHIEVSGNPVELLVVGCALGVADGFANALRNQGQAAHLKTADSMDALDKQLSAGAAHLALVNAENPALPTTQVIAKLRAANPTGSVLLVAKDLAAHRSMAIEFDLQDLLDIEDDEHVALAIRREHQTHQLRQDIRRLKRQLDEAEERSNLLVQSSRDAIAYIHDGMYLHTNQTYLDMFGYESADELDGLPIMDMIDADSRGNFKAALRKVSETGKHAEEFRCVTSDGQSFNARMEFSPPSIDAPR